MEVKEKGWGFGQIDDMKTCVDSLYANGTLTALSPLSVTDHSMVGGTWERHHGPRSLPQAPDELTKHCLYQPQRQTQDHAIYGGATYPSAVASSQLHYGAATPIFLEDQPLYRGDVIDLAAQALLAAFEVKLLVNNFATNDFGDTHSLVLLVDSLVGRCAISQTPPFWG